MFLYIVVFLQFVSFLFYMFWGPIYFLLFERVRSRTPPKNMSLRNVHPEGGATAFFFYVFVHTLAGTLPKKMSLRNAHPLGGAIAIFFLRF